MGKKKNKSVKKSGQQKRGTNLNSKKTIPQPKLGDFREHYYWNMSEAPMPGENTSVFQLIPAAFFTAIVIMIVRMTSYPSNSSQFYWGSDETTTVTDFFSYYKTVAIFVCALFAIVFLLYRLFVRNFYIKRTILYLPALVYIVFVLLSYAFSSHRDIAWSGWDDRLEGTLVILCYIFMLFYTMNLVNSERGVKTIIYALAGSSFMLSLLGLSQALDKDFFRTTIGQKLIVPNTTNSEGVTVWEMIDKAAAKGEQILEFTFQNREIYQTVYNINYVSFYLTLLIPIFGLLFIHEKEKLVKKIIWAVLFCLLIFNLIGSASSSGFLGMFAAVLIGIIIFNKKLLSWWKPMLILIAITVLVGGITFDRWSEELTNSIGGAAGNSQTKEASTVSKHRFDYFANKGNTIELSLDGNVAVIDLATENMITVKDEDDNTLDIKQDQSSGIVTVNDERFEPLLMQPTSGENGSSLFMLGLRDEEQTWTFTRTDDGVKFLNNFNKPVKLENVPHWGFENNMDFGSGRGFIWSRTFPMIKDTLFIGNGADTFVIYFPQKDYVGKYNAGWKIGMTVDKPHSMYLGVAVNTGLISLFALLTLFGIYIVQSFRLYFNKKTETFLDFTGAGIFLGICGFLAAALVNDSSVSVMPMFYGLLGTGIAINMLLRKKSVT